ncbi:MAG TPA: hypothetical protein VJZ26_05765 [Blastocatellia bacterium]|nr:hypothetical protein [Blastocatellia bacterium]
MLKIRAEQFEVFQPVAESAFVRRVAEHLRDNHADVMVRLPNEVILVKQISDDRLRGMAKEGMARAREYGMDWESAVTAFVVLMFVAAPNFDKHPLIQRILRDERTPANSRIDQLWERTSEENWEAVRKNYDPTAWVADSKEVSR